MDRPEEAKLMKFSDPSDFSIFNNVGEGLLVEILARLSSSRAAVQLKLVCKSWCSLISSHYFITVFNHRRHDPIHRSSSSSGCFIFQSVVDPSLSMVRWGYHDSPGDFHRPDFSFLPCPQSSIRLKASCADLILCSTSSSPMSLPIFFYVCNLLTKQWAALPSAPLFQLDPMRYAAISTGFLCVLPPCSLCSTQFVLGHNNNNFMVVRICVVPIALIHPQFEFKAQLFSSEEGEWKSVVISSPRAVRFRVRSTKTLVPYKGMLHWLISGFVLVYDPYNCPERFCRVIDTPADIDIPAEENCPANMIAGIEEELEQSSRTIGLFQDRLRITHVWFSLYYIWDLEDYDMGKWSFVHKISCTASPRLSFLPNHHHNLDPNFRDTGFSYIDGSAFYWTNSYGWWVAKGIVHWITHQCWPTPVPPLTACTIQRKYFREFLQKKMNGRYRVFSPPPHDLYSKKNTFGGCLVIGGGNYGEKNCNSAIEIKVR